MTKRPILFSGPMVRAILDGRKTQTRRVVKLDGITIDERDGSLWPYQTGHDEWMPCPYGQPGDTLWVREAHAIKPCLCCAIYRADENILHAAERWRPSIHMPRWASRLTLRVTDVRVERVRDISEDDALAEGVSAEDAASTIVVVDPDSARCHLDTVLSYTARGAFAALWDSINGKTPGRSWADNPWVWAVSFEADGLA